MAKDMTYSHVPENCLFIISEIKNSEENFSVLRKIRINENRKKIPKPLIDIASDLEELYHNIYDVNLYIYKAEKGLTIIEIQYYPRTSLEPGYRKSMETQEPMWHCKVYTPLYYSDTNEKFDINWQFGALNHKWKMFWWKLQGNKRHGKEVR